MKFLLYVFFTACMLFSAASAAVTGTVIDGAGTPVPDAMVTFTNVANRLVWTYSDAAGNFNLSSSGGTPVINQGSGFTFENPIGLKSRGSLIFFDADGKSPVKITVYLSSGSVIGNVDYGILGSGRYSVNPLAAVENHTPNTVYIIKAQSAGHEAFGKVISSGMMSGKSPVKVGNLSRAPEPSLSKISKSSAVDNIRVGKSNYQAVIVPIDTYDDAVGTVTITDAGIEGRVSTLLASLSQDELLGQITMSDFAVDFAWGADNPPETHDARNTAKIKSLYLGFQMSKGNQSPVEGNIPVEWQNDIIRIQTAALEAPKQIPLIVSSDLVHGVGASKGTTIMPHNIGLGCTWDPVIVEKTYRVTAIEAQCLGYNMTYAPSVSIPRHLAWGRSYEGFSENTQLATTMAAAAVRGLQGTDLSHPFTIGATAKHFVGDGGTTGGLDAANGDITGDNGVALSDAELLAIHLPPYQAAVDLGVASIMPSLSPWKGTNLTIKGDFLTQLLKVDMGFDGFVQGDFEAHWRSVGGTSAAMAAGLDVPMSWITNDADRQVNDYKAIWGAQQARLEDAAKRVLRIKYRLGLFDSFTMPNPANLALVGSPEHRAIAREAVRKSMVLLKNDNSTLPLSKTASIHLMGDHADNIGLQCGGWTITWQGTAGATTTGTTIKQAFENASTGTVTHSNVVNAAADVIVVVVGESPYAEFMGDIGTDVAKSQLAAAHSSMITSAAGSGKPMVCVMISGRPLDITDEIAQCDAFVQAWLPGTEGNGIADVMFGDFDFTGKLSNTWPKNYTQEPVNFGDGDYASVDVQFTYGYGLNAAGAILP